tara:strand:+ start:1850 stop:2050 length:201 start_codon:yes stop_codon:yes gene_type:complete
VKYIFLIFFIFISSCGYPDIDTVPKFEKMKISKEEATELCKINNSDIDNINKCLSRINYNKENEQN